MNQRLRAPRERVDGILLLDKPRGLSSNDALVRARRLLNAVKAGHGGTLDPMATGLLPLMFGEATKFAQDALGADKVYLAELTLGVTTDTADAEGEVRIRSEVTVDEAAFRHACAAFTGPIDQMPPMHSALKRNGRPLYEYARAGIELERQARRITIHAIELLSFDPPRARIRVSCSKGTYLRVLAVEIGERLGCGAHLSALRRERAGPFSLDAAIGLEALEALSPLERRARLGAVDSLVLELPRIDLGAEAAARFRNGQRLPGAALGAALRALPGDDEPPTAAAAVRGTAGRAAPGFPGPLPTRVRVYFDARLLGLANWRTGVLSPLRLVSVEPHPDPCAALAADPILHA